MTIFFTINLYGSDKAKCEKLFKSAIYNFYLENTCKFDKHVSSSLRKEFGNQSCTNMFSDADMKSLNNEVLGDSYQSMNKVGKDKFCKNNQVEYEKLGGLYR
jgi:hypothetical protein